MDAALKINPTQLRNFHKNHFPNQVIPLLQDTRTVLLDSSDPALQQQQQEEEEDDDDDDDDESEEKLGWYRDGFKRTLTDEQIAMFRHSEIERLLRQRRLNANVANGHPDVYAKWEPEQSKQIKRDKRSKRPNERAAPHPQDVELRYGQGGENPAAEPAHGERKDHYWKIVSYMDEPDCSNIKDGIDAISRKTPDSQSLHWPKLGS